jgi:hypothetical protein
MQVLDAKITSRGAMGPQVVCHEPLRSEGFFLQKLARTDGCARRTLTPAASEGLDEGGRESLYWLDLTIPVGAPWERSSGCGRPAPLAIDCLVRPEARLPHLPD